MKRSSFCAWSASICTTNCNFRVFLSVVITFSLTDAKIQVDQDVETTTKKEGHRELAPHLDYDDTEYNPKPGFEPYWPVGEWVYKETYTTHYMTPSTIPPLANDKPCPKQYRHIKEVCATKLSMWWKVVGCNTYWWWYQYPDVGCTATNMDHLYGYHTFPTFCDFLDYHERWSLYEKPVFVHVGACVHGKPMFHPYNPFYTKYLQLKRFDHYMAQLKHTFLNSTTEKDLTIGPYVPLTGIV